MFNLKIDREKKNSHKSQIIQNCKSHDGLMTAFLCAQTKHDIFFQSLHKTDRLNHLLKIIKYIYRFISTQKKLKKDEMLLSLSYSHGVVVVVVKITIKLNSPSTNLYIFIQTSFISFFSLSLFYNYLFWANAGSTKQWESKREKRKEEEKTTTVCRLYKAL